MYIERDGHAVISRHVPRHALVHPRILGGHAVNPQRAIGQHAERGGGVYRVRADVLAVIGPRDLRGGNAGDLARHQHRIVDDDCVLSV